jgi:hypothetical protein
VYVSDLLDELAAAPRLSGAACRRHGDLFDTALNSRGAAAEQAIVICRSCPALQECRAWVESMRPRPLGVFGGQLNARQAIRSSTRGRRRP